MSDIHLKEFLAGRTQKEVADVLGVTQGAVNQMLKSNRDIYFRQVSEGIYESYEIKKTRFNKAA